MAKRYLLAPIVGTGTREDPYRSSVRGLPGINVVDLIPTGPDGRPIKDFSLARVGGANIMPALSASGVDPFPDFPLDAKLSAMQNATRANLKARLEARGFDGSIADNADGFRDMVRAVGQSMEPSFNEDAFDVSEVVLP